MIYLDNETEAQEISVPRSFGVVTPNRKTYLSTDDIAADLTTDSDTKALAASQGVVLAGMIAEKADADDVYTKSETDTLLDAKADTATTLAGYGITDAYTQTETDALLADKADADDVYTKTEADALLADKADADDVYTKTEADALLADKADSDDVYTKDEADALLDAKQDTLTAGTNITIDPDTNTISASGGGSSDPTGVISQTQTYAADSSYYTMSDVVTGTIPQMFIDLVETAGATFNTNTGYFELNGLTDISYEEMRKIYNAGWLCKIDYTGLGTFAATWNNTAWVSLVGGRTHFGGISTHQYQNWHINSNGMWLNNPDVEVLPFGYYNNVAYCVTFDGLASMFVNCPHLKSIGYIKYTSTTAAYIRTCPALQDCYIYGLRANLYIGESLNLTPASVAFMINNAGTASITITLHATAYARAMADADVQTALANKTNVTLASA